MSESAPPLSAAAYAAGELSSAECAAFEERLRAEPALADEVAFWRSMRGGLHPATRPDFAPCPDLAATLLRRAALERQALPARRLRLPRWTVLVTAAAACLALGFGFAAGAGWARQEPPPIARNEVREIPVGEPMAYGEDGSGLTPPPAQVSLASWMPLTAIEQADATRPLAMTPAVRPWIGLWTRQARLVLPTEPAREAHLVVRIVEGSPGWKAGLRPGDMVVSIDHCTIDSPTCLGQHLAKAAPGSVIELEFWSAADAAFRSATVTLTAVHE